MVLAIYGAGATAQELYEMIQNNTKIQKWQSFVFLDDTKPQGFFLGIPRLSFETFSSKIHISFFLNKFVSSLIIWQSKFSVDKL